MRQSAPLPDLPVADENLFGILIAEMLEKAGAKKSQLPKISDFPSGTKFVIKEFDVPLVWIPYQGWFNWFGGVLRPYDESFLRVDNNWLADSFEEWISVVEESLR